MLNCQGCWPCGRVTPRTPYLSWPDVREILGTPPENKQKLTRFHGTFVRRYLCSMCCMCCALSFSFLGFKTFVLDGWCPDQIPLDLNTSEKMISIPDGLPMQDPSSPGKRWVYQFTGLLMLQLLRLRTQKWLTFVYLLSQLVKLRQEYRPVYKMSSVIAR